MIVEIDVSGEDILDNDYTICVASSYFVKVFKFSPKLANVLGSKYGQLQYRYKKSRKSKATFKVRLYYNLLYIQIVKNI